MFDLILKNCNIVNEGSIYESDIAIKNNRIELIDKDISFILSEITLCIS